MKENGEINRINYANAKHHRELIRQHIDPNMINKIEVSNHPSQNYQKAFKDLYQDELEKTMEEHKYKKMNQSYLEGNNRAVFHQRTTNTMYEMSVQNSSSVSRIQRPFYDFEEEKAKKYNKMVENQLIRGNNFFKEQDAYQQRKKLEMEANNLALRQQLNQKEMQKIIRNEEIAKESYQVHQNKIRQMQHDYMNREKNKMAQQDLRSEIVQQIELERRKKHQKSIANIGGCLRHNPITNPIEYHIDNPYILCKMQDKENAYKNSLQ